MHGKPDLPLYFRGVLVPVLNWLESLPKTVLDARPLLWTTYASVSLATGQAAGVEQKLQAAETAIAANTASAAILQGAEPDDKTRDLIGRIAAIRATLAIYQNQVETIICQSLRALEYLHPDNLSLRANAHWTLGYAHILQGDRAAAGRAYTEALSISQAIGHFIITLMATLGLGNVREAENQLDLAAQSYRRVVQLAGDPPLLVACEAHLGLARICYAWNDMDAAQQHGQQSIQLARQLEHTDRFVACDVFLARLKLAQGDVEGAANMLAQTDQSVRKHSFVLRIPEVATAQVLTFVRQGNLAAAAHLAQAHNLLLSQARVHLARGEASAAIAVLKSYRQQVEAKGWQDERLKTLILQALAFHAHSEKDKATQVLYDALALAEPGGFTRIFVDEGSSMAELLSEGALQGINPEYVGKLLAALEQEKQEHAQRSVLIQPLSPRELEVLQLIAQGLSNDEIAKRLFLALDSVKGHNRRIYDKLEVQRRTEAVARARELGLL
jgi:LuxR family maltose regulon positive regulatory protein